MTLKTVHLNFFQEKTIQSLLSKALEEKEESLTNLNTAKTNYKANQED